MLLVIMHNDEDYLERMMSTFKEKKAITEAMVIEGKDLALSIGQTTNYMFGGGLPAPLSEEYDHALVTVVGGKKEAEGLIKILEESHETIALSDKGLVATLPLDCIEDLAGRGRRRKSSSRGKHRVG